MPETMETADLEYLNWGPDDAPVAVHLHLDAVDGIGRDVLGGLKTGFLLGRVDESGKPEIWVERYQRIDLRDDRSVEAALAEIGASAELAVVGFYRAGQAFEPDPGDIELIRQHFGGRFDLCLLIRTEGPDKLSGRFFLPDAERTPQPAGEVFPFHGRFLAPGRVRVLVPDFVPEPVIPSRMPLPEPESILAGEGRGEATVRTVRPRTWWPLAAALLLLGGVGFLVVRPGLLTSPAPLPLAPAIEPVRPLGLSVDTGSGDAWRISWNPSATALQDVRTIQLFIREGDEQNTVDLTPNLAAGSYLYRHHGNEVTFRMEATSNAGRVTAESFRLTVPAASAAAPAPRAPATALRAIHRVPPTVPASIRPRIRSRIPIEIRVEIDARGKVLSAAPVVKPGPGLRAYLAGRAVNAARQWRFEPARGAEGQALRTQTIQFVFEN